jgi:hypothetical protein
MRRILVVAMLCATFLPVAACSDKPAADAANAKPTASGSAAPSASTGPSGAPEGSAVTGTAKDKGACEAISVTLSAWGASFAEAAAGLSTAGGDVNKVKPVVDKVKAANTKAAGELRAQANKTSDASVKKVANDLAASLEKVNTQLDPNQIAQDPDKLSAIFDAPEYAASAEAYEKVCGTA